MEKKSRNSPEQLTLFAAGSHDHANHSVRPGSEKARKMTVTSGRNISGLYKKSDLVGLLAKMLLDSSVWASTKCFLTWKVQTTPAKRLLFQLVPSTPHIEGIESGSSQEEMLWATPNTMDHLPQRSPEALHRLATTHRKGRTRPSNLREQVDQATSIMWPTPSATPRGPHTGAIAGQVAPDGKSRVSAKGTKWGATLETAVIIQEGTQISGQLNPMWVEWLMGFPIGWTDLNS